jgi:hypothetical protein
MKISLKAAGITALFFTVFTGAVASGSYLLHKIQPTSGDIARFAIALLSIWFVCIVYSIVKANLEYKERMKEIAND